MACPDCRFTDASTAYGLPQPNPRGALIAGYEKVRPPFMSKLSALALFYEPG